MDLPLPDPQMAGEPSEEVEIWRGGYDLRAFAPLIVLACVLTAILFLTVGLIISAWEGASPFRMGVDGILIVGWVGILGFITYRVTGAEYVLTSRRLFVRRNFARPGDPGLDLRQIKDVRTHQTPWEKRLSIGRVSVLDAFGTRLPVALASVYDPARVAALIRKQVKKSQEGEKG